jgi:hypothetical protein
VSTITTGYGSRSAVADRLLAHHRAYYRPRAVRPPPPAPPEVSRLGATMTARGALTRVLVIRIIACLVLWAAGGIVYGFWQLGDALVPRSQHGAVICGTTQGVGSVPGC